MLQVSIYRSKETDEYSLRRIRMSTESIKDDVRAKVNSWRQLENSQAMSKLAWLGTSLQEF